MTGYTVGGGLEWMFAPGWSVFGEYNYLDFGTKNVNFPSTGLVPGFGPAGALADTNAIKLTAQEVIVGVNYKFNSGSPVVCEVLGEIVAPPARPLLASSDGSVRLIERREKRPDLSQKSLQIHGLGVEIGTADLDTFGAVAGKRVGRQRDDRNGWQSPDWP